MFRLLFMVLCAFSLNVSANNIPTASPEEVGMSSARLSIADEVIMRAIRDHRTPGAVLAVVRHGKIAYLKAYGNRQTYPNTLPMTTQTVFDMASCTKPMATAIAAMLLVERGLLRLSDPVSTYIPGFENWHGEGKDSVTIRVEDLFTHTSGLPAYAPVSSLAEPNGKPNPAKLMAHIAHVKRNFRPRSDMQYSCLNYITLQNIVERITGESLRTFAANNIFVPLGMTHTDFLPCTADKNGKLTNTAQARWLVNGEKADLTPIAPTERLANGMVKQGQVHDPLACSLNGGVSGNAGLFSSAEDVATLCAMLQNGGEWGGKRILSPLTVKAMRAVPTHFNSFGRAYGWDVNSAYASNKGDLLSNEAYGHTGYTGTSIVIDPVNDVSIILLCNSVHPVDASNVIRLRAQVANAVAASITNETAPYPPNYYARMRVFAAEEPIRPTDIVMLGNSLTEGGRNWAEKLGKPNVRNRGISGDVVMGVDDRLFQITPYKPSKIFLLIGVNDVSHDLSVDSIVNSIRLLVDHIRAQSPKTKLVLQSLLPIRESTGRWKRLQGKTDMIPQINARLETLARERGLTFINLFPHFAEPGTNIMRADLTSDGLHLNKAGYDVWVKQLKPHL